MKRIRENGRILGKNKRKRWKIEDLANEEDVRAAWAVVRKDIQEGDKSASLWLLNQLVGTPAPSKTLDLPTETTSYRFIIPPRLKGRAQKGVLSAPKGERKASTEEAKTAQNG